MTELEIKAEIKKVYERYNGEPEMTENGSRALDDLYFKLDELKTK